MHIEIATSVTDELVTAFASLIPQLSSSAAPVTREALQSVIDDEAVTVFVARHDEKIVGTLSLAIFHIPTGVRAWIEDVVVDDAARGLGVGLALTQAAIDHATNHGARSVDLTSRASRTAAHRLYERAGFAIRETNVYRYSLES
jgi:ribosomal protein S18 acetylase RimI-like enzyme